MHSLPCLALFLAQEIITVTPIFALNIQKGFIKSSSCIMRILSTEHVLRLTSHNFFIWLQIIKLATLSNKVSTSFSIVGLLKSLLSGLDGTLGADVFERVLLRPNSLQMSHLSCLTVHEMPVSSYLEICVDVSLVYQAKTVPPVVAD